MVSQDCPGYSPAPVLPRQGDGTQELAAVGVLRHRGRQPHDRGRVCADRSPSTSAEDSVLREGEYWHHRLGAWFFNATGQRPVDRSARDIQREVVGVGVELLRTESRTVLLLYPESTRSYDGKVHAGGLSPARIAIQADVPLVPIGLVGMEKIQPPGKKLWQLRPFRRAGIHIGAPIYPWAAGSRPEGVIKGAIETIEAKVLTERAMRAIADLCGKDYSPDRLKIPGR